MVPPPSSMYVAGALELPNTTAVGAGVLTLGGDRFLHNYGPAADAGNTFVGQLAGNFTLGGLGLFEGMYNTAVGYQSLSSNTTGFSNTTSGFQSLYFNTTGSDNTASGYWSLHANTTGSDNTASGAASLASNTTGYWNTASGFESLWQNTTGFSNTASGFRSLWQNTTGSSNTASGTSAGSTNATGSNNTFLGAYSDAAADNLTNATAVGYGAIVNASNKVRIGNGSVLVIEGQVAWSFPSDARLKENIRDLDLGLDFVLQLRPVSFTMKQGNGRTDMGFLAQDVEAVLGDDYNVLGIGGDQDRTLSLRGTDLIAPMVKAIQEQQTQIADQAKTVQTQQVQIEAQRGEIQELKAAVEALRARVQAQTVPARTADLR